jgi:hypothetical protein
MVAAAVTGIVAQDVSIGRGHPKVIMTIYHGLFVVNPMRNALSHNGDGQSPNRRRDRHRISAHAARLADY